MIKKCPYCDFEPIQDQLVCPNCGSELNAENLKQNTDEQKNNDHVEMANDDINWSNFDEVSLGSVIEHFHEVIDSTTPSTKSTVESDLTKIEENKQTKELTIQEDLSEPFEDNPILSAYIRHHKEGANEEELIAAIKEQQQKEGTSLSNESQKKEPPESLVVENPTAEMSNENLKKERNEALNEAFEQETKKELVKEVQAKSLVEEPKSVTTPTPKESEKTAISIEELAILDNQVVDAKENQTTKIAEKNQIDQEKLPELKEKLEEVSEETIVTKAQEIKVEPVVKVTKTTSELKETATPKALRNQKSKKTLYLIGATSLFFAVGAWWLYSDYQAKEQAAQAIALQNKKELADLNTQLNQLFLDDKHEFLKPDVTLAQVKEFKQDLTPYKIQEGYRAVEQLSETLYQKASLLENVNQYFTEPIIVGDQLVKDVHIKDMTPVVTNSVNETTPFAKLINEALEQAKAEYNQVKNAQTAVASVTATLKEGQLTDQFSKETLEATQKEVAQLFDSPMKEELVNALQPVEEALVAKEAAEKEAAEKEQQLAAQKKAAEEAAAQRQASLSIRFNEGQEILNRNTPTNRNYQPIISSRQSDLNDINNPAWQWAPGVYNTFINTVINRGYVVPGGFILEPARIENGEGYYNLYATSNQSSLLKGISQSAMPFYIVTVNAKTGFFKGNG